MRKIRMGMIGGGSDAFIGNIHRKAACMDGIIELVCGAFSRDAGKSKASGEALFLPEDRAYASWQEMLETESTLPEDVKMDFVTIVTPNHAHFAPAMMALDKGFHVVIEKPMTFTLSEAKQLQQKIAETGLLLCVTYTYSGYPMVKQARVLVRDGHLGQIRKVMVEYMQGWLAGPSEKEGNKQAEWRTDPSKAGMAGAMGDIGTHAAHLAEYVSRLKITAVGADINTIVEGRELDDDGNVLLSFDTGASGSLIASQIAAGEENNLSIRIYGEKGGLEWRQQEPNSLILKWKDRPLQILRAGAGQAGLHEGVSAECRTPAGHPEGYIEAFANLYRNFAKAIQGRLQSTSAAEETFDFPGITDGVRGMAFIETVITSGKSDKKWTSFIE